MYMYTIILLPWYKRILPLWFSLDLGLWSITINHLVVVVYNFYCAYVHAVRFSLQYVKFCHILANITYQVAALGPAYLLPELLNKSPVERYDVLWEVVQEL